MSNSTWRTWRPTDRSAGGRYDRSMAALELGVSLLAVGAVILLGLLR